MENMLDPALLAYRERVAAMRPERRAALLRSHESLVADIKRWEALSADLRATLIDMVAIVREQHQADSVVISEDT